MQVWDTAGQERFRTITQSYYRSAHGAMIAYDISRRATFDSVQRWIHELQQFGAANVLTALIGTAALLCDTPELTDRGTSKRLLCFLRQQAGPGGRARGALRGGLQASGG